MTTCPTCGLDPDRGIPEGVIKARDAWIDQTWKALQPIIDAVIAGEITSADALPMMIAAGKGVKT